MLRPCQPAAALTDTAGFVASILTSAVFRGSMQPATSVA